MPDRDWFFIMAPPEFRAPLVILATVATVIASQAVITGAYSLSQQAIQLGLLPRMDVKRTSETQSGQIYLPQINSMLLVGVLMLVVIFQTSDNLSHAYGLAVTGTMLVTTCLAFIVVRQMWKWGPIRTAHLIGPLVVMDLTFLAANALKFLSGGWAPVLLGGALAAVMFTWTRGTQLLFDKTRRDSVPMKDLAEILRARAPHRVAGTAVFLTSDPDVAPVALMHNLKHNKVLHEKNIILTVLTAETPRVRDQDRIKIDPVSDEFTKLTMTFGFMESPNIPKALALCRKQGLKFDIMSTSFFLGRRSVVPAARSGMPLWQDKLFILLSKNATQLPPTSSTSRRLERVVEMGAQVTVMNLPSPSWGGWTSPMRSIGRVGMSDATTIVGETAGVRPYGRFPGTGTMRALLFAPRGGVDTQSPHTQDELYVVQSATASSARATRPPPSAPAT